MNRYRIHFDNKETHEIEAESPRAARRHTRRLYPYMTIVRTQDLSWKARDIQKEIARENIQAK